MIVVVLFGSHQDVLEGEPQIQHLSKSVKSRQGDLIIYEFASLSESLHLGIRNLQYLDSNDMNIRAMILSEISEKKLYPLINA